MFYSSKENEFQMLIELEDVEYVELEKIIFVQLDFFDSNVAWIYEV